jgi:hypothetical protein
MKTVGNDRKQAVFVEAIKNCLISLLKTRKLAFLKRTYIMRHLILTVIMVFFATLMALGQQNSAQTEKLKAEADQLFEADAFAEAYPLYSQLVSLNPKDAELNFKFGTCTIYAGEPKETAVRHLNFAIQKGCSDPRVYFYMGKAMHLNYEFAKAIPFYNDYLAKRNPKDKNPLPAEQSIQMCKEGKQLLTNVKDIVVLEKVGADVESFFRFYNLEEIGGKVLAIPEELRSKIDKKKEYKGVLYKNGNAPEVYFSSYGEDEENGIDIFQAFLLGDGTFSSPKRLPNTINTPEDEEFAYMHPDGKTFYFASKGHNSMGGYDIFKSLYNGSSQEFSQPENLDFAINTPDDDLFFVTDSLHQTAYFASARSSSQGELHVYKVMVDGIPVQLMFVKGVFANENNPSKSGAKVTIVDELSGKIITQTSTNDFNGDYVLSFPRAGLYRLSLQVIGEPLIHEGVIELPAFDHAVALEQELKLVNEDGREKLIINNKFDKELDEDLAALSAAVLRGKAGLEVNATAELIAQAKEIANPKRDISEAHLLAGLSESQTAEVVKTEMLTESDVLKVQAKKHQQRAAVAINEAKSENTKAEQKLSDATELASKFQDLEGEAYYEAFEEYSEMIDEAEQLQNKAKDLVAVANVLMSSAEKSNVLAEELVKNAAEIESSTANEDVDALVSILQQEKERKRNNSDVLKESIDDLAASASEKEVTAKQFENRSLAFQEEEKNISAKIKSKKLSLENTKKKSEKAQLAEEIFQLEGELSYIQDEYVKAQNQLIAASDESIRSRQQSLLAQNFKNQDPEVNQEPASEADLKAVTAIVETQDLSLASIKIDREEKAAAIADGPLKAGVELAALPTLSQRAAETSLQLKPVKDLKNDYEAAQLQIAESPVGVESKQLILAKQTLREAQEQSNFLASIKTDSPEEQKAIELELKSLIEFQEEMNASIALKEKESNNMDMTNSEAMSFLENYRPEIQVDLKTANSQELPEFNKLEASKRANTNINQQIKMNNELILSSNDEAEIAQINKENQALELSLSSLEQSQVLSLQAVSIDVQNRIIQLMNAENTPDENNERQLDLLREYGAFLADYEVDNESEAKDLNEMIERNKASIAQLESIQAENVAVNSLSESTEITRLPDTEDLLIQAIDPEFPKLDLNGNTNVSDLDEASLITRIDEHENLVFKAQEAMDERVFALDSSNSSDEKERLQLEITRLQSLINRKSQEQLKLISALDKLNEASNLANNDVVDVNEAEDSPKSVEVNASSSSSPEVQIENWDDLEQEEQFNLAFEALHPKSTLVEKTVLEHAQFETLSAAITAAQFERDIEEIELKSLEIAELEAQIVQLEKRNEVKKVDKQIEKAFFDRSAAEVRTAEALIVVSTEEFASREIEIDKIKNEKKAGLDSLVWLAQEIRLKERKAEEKQQLAREILAEAAPEIDEIKQADMYKRAAVLQMDALNEQGQIINLLNNTESVLSLNEEQIAQLQSGERNSDDSLIAENEARPDVTNNEGLDSESSTTNLEKEAELSTDSNEAVNETLSAEEEEILKRVLAEVNSSFPNIEVLAEELELTSPEEAALALDLNETELEIIKSSEAFEELISINDAQIEDQKERVRMINERNEMLSNVSVLKEGMVRLKQASLMSESNAEKVGLEAEFEQLRQQAKVNYEEIAKMDENIAILSAEIKEKEEAKATYIFNLDTAEIIAEAEDKSANDSEGVGLIENDSPRELAVSNAATNAASTFYFANNNRFQEYDFNFPKVLEAEVFNIVDKTPYSEEQPIPVDVALPEGIVYKVQVGAFRTQIPQNLYSQFAPVSGEKTGTGLTRYAVGLFKAFTSADLAKNEVRSMGYSDAFVVAYKDGVRIPLYEARAASLANGVEELANRSSNNNNDVARSETNIQSTETNITSGELNATSAETLASNTEISLAIPSEMDWSRSNGSFYTVQVGVYSKLIDQNQLPGVNSVMIDRVNNKLFRYTSGQFNSLQDAQAAKDRIRAAGIADAFITAYQNGKKVAVSSMSPSLVSDEPSPEQETNVEDIITYQVVFGTFIDEVPSNIARAMLSLERKHGVIQKSNGESTSYLSKPVSSKAQAQQIIASYRALGVELSVIQTLTNGELGEQ